MIKMLNALKETQNNNATNHRRCQRLLVQVGLCLTALNSNGNVQLFCSMPYADRASTSYTHQLG